MKSNIILSIFASGVLALGFAACSPESHEVPAPVITSAELVEGIAYTVTPDPANPNKITLRTLIKGATPVWNTPNGYSENPEVKLDLPFAGEYPVTFGVMTGSGVVWGDPYTIKIDVNDFSMLSDEIWTNLAGGVDENGQGNPKTWVPMDRAYPPYAGSAPVAYMDPSNTNGAGSADIIFGTGNWQLNWDPGFQSWLIPADDPYMGSSMVLSLDPVKGCVAEINRVDGNGPSSVTGGFTLNNSDPKRPTISFSGCELLHAAWGDGVSNNYYKDLKIIECTPYVLQLAIMRTNSEGAWWIVWNYVAKDVQDGTVSIPTGEPDLLTTIPVAEPTYTDLGTELFTISGDNATYVASATTLLLNDEKPYDQMWWNDAKGAWEWLDNYGTAWMPAIAEPGDFAMTLEKAGNAAIEDASGSQEAKFTIEGNKVVFDKEVTLLAATGTLGEVAVRGTEFTVMRCSADNNEVVLGIPAGHDRRGAVNRYLCVNMTIKPVGGGQTGPTVLKVDQSKLEVYIEAGKYLRCQFYNPWAGKGDDEWPIDPSKLKLKKNQKLVVKFSVNGVEWTATPKAAFCCNMDGFEWEPNCFSNSQAYDFNTTGENTMELVNNTGATYAFPTQSALIITIQLDGFATTTSADGVTFNVSSLTIE